MDARSKDTRAAHRCGTQRTRNHPYGSCGGIVETAVRFRRGLGDGTAQGPTEPLAAFARHASSASYHPNATKASIEHRLFDWNHAPVHHHWRHACDSKTSYRGGCTHIERRVSGHTSTCVDYG